MKRFIMVNLMIILIFNVLYAAQKQNISKDIAADLLSKLEKIGFENLYVRNEGTLLVIYYENNVFRNENEAVDQIINIVQSEYLFIDSLKIVLQKDQIPLLEYKTFFKNPDLFPSSIFTEGKKKIWRSADCPDIKIPEDFRNKSGFKLDLILYPEFHALFGGYGGIKDDFIIPQINISPLLSTNIWPGSSLSAQLIIPIYNKISDEGDLLRAGLCTFNQTLNHGHGFYSATTSGHFRNHRYGSEIEVHKMFNNFPISLGAHAGYTGYAIRQGKKLLYTKTNEITWEVYAKYFLFDYHFFTRISYRSYFSNVSSYRFDINRWFDEVAIGFFIQRLSYDYNGHLNAGLTISLPLYPSKYSKSGIIRIRPTDYFNWSYSSKSHNAGYYNYGNSLEKRIDDLRVN